MKITIPISQSDVHLLTDHAEALVALGPIPNHEVVLFPTPSVESQALTAAERLRSICNNVTVVKCPYDFEGGWPVAPNNHWHFVVLHLERSGNKSPWLWLELDAVPVKNGWADKLQQAFFDAGKPFMGCVKPVTWIKDGKVIRKDDDDMLMGVAIYPPGIPSDELIKPLFNNVGRSGSTALKEPFDLYLRHPMRHRGVANSGTICDMWRSERYTLEDYVFTCHAVEGEPRARGGAVPVEAVLVHGCKDGSLHRLVRNGGTKVEVVKEPVTQEPVTQEPVTQEPVTQEPVIKEAPLTESEIQIKELLDSGEKVRLSALVTRFGIGRSQAAEIVLKLGYEVLPAGWIKKPK